MNSRVGWKISATKAAWLTLVFSLAVSSAAHAQAVDAPPVTLPAQSEINPMTLEVCMSHYPCRFDRGAAPGGHPLEQVLPAINELLNEEAEQRSATNFERLRREALTSLEPSLFARFFSVKNQTKRLLNERSLQTNS
jgi:hypothetical protein